MERNAGKNGPVNLIAAVLIFVAALRRDRLCPLAGGASWPPSFSVSRALVAFVSWFQMRLEENERLEKLELDELANSKGGSALFEAKDAEVFPAQRAREQFEKFFVPGFAVLLLLLEAGGAWLLWRWTGQATGVIAPERAMPALVAVRHFCAAAVFVRAFFRHDGAAGKPPAAAAGREFSARGRVYLRADRAGHRGRRGEISQGRFLGRARSVRAARFDGGGKSADAAAGNLPAAREGQSRPAALRQPRGRAVRAAGKPVHHGGADAGLSIRLQGFRDVVFPTARKKSRRAAAGATGGAALVHLHRVR